MQQKSKRQLLNQRLDRIKRNSQILMNKMDAQINSMEQVKKDLDDKSQRMTNWTNQFQNLMTEMAHKLIGNNPLVQNSSNNGILPKRQSVKFVCEKIISAKKICILTGAGVSKNIGIPTFRGKDGLYSKNFAILTKNKQIIEYSPQQFLTMKTFIQYPDQIWEWCNKMKQLVQSKSPGPEHQLINQICLTLKRIGSEVCLVTTNIDGLHKKPTLTNKENQRYQLYEIHGNFRKYLCLNCHQQYPNTTKNQNFECKKCHCGVLRPFVMFFDERYDNLFDPTNLRDRQFDVTIVVGTSLATGLSIKIVSNSKIIVQINPQCVIKSGQTYQFEKQSQQILSQILIQLKMNNKKIKDE